MLRKLGLSLAIASVLLAGKVNALGMGEIRVISALNEPLRAEIALFQVDNLSPLQIKSKMADLNDFALSGLATQRALSGVRFQIRVRANGTGRIILTSRLPVTEPFMNFLVEVNWPSGRLIREYTLLLDPPANQAVQNQRNFNAADNSKLLAGKQSQPNQVKQPERASPKRPAMPEPTVKKGQYYIDEKDTLWDVAIATRPKKTISPHQMMVLIQRKNPQAFPNANINVMKARTVIDLPVQAEINSLSVSDARAEVTRQTRLWKSGKLPKVVKQSVLPEKAVGKAGATKKPLTVGATASPTQNKTEKVATTVVAKKMPTQALTSADGETEKGVLDVITSQEADLKLAAQVKAQALVLAASKDSEKIAKLLQDNAEQGIKLALSEESIDKLKRDNTELNDKLNIIVKQLEDINRLILLKDEQLAGMQDDRDIAEKEQLRKAIEEQDKSWLDRLLENPLGMAAAGFGWLLAILAGVFLLLRRKNKAVVPVDENKSEPSISMPEQFVEKESIEEPEDDLEEDLEESSSTEDDMDLDLDLDMDLDESLADTSLYLAEDDDSIDDDDLAAELNAQLDVPEDEDEDLEFELDGIDTAEFDLGNESGEQEGESAEQKQALAEFAAAMDEGDVENEDPFADETLDEDPFADETLDEDPFVEETLDEELELELIPDQVTSLDELEALADSEQIADDEQLLDELNKPEVGLSDDAINDFEIELDEGLEGKIDLNQAQETLQEITDEDDQPLSTANEAINDLSLELDDAMVDDDLQDKQIADIEADLLDNDISQADFDIAAQEEGSQPPSADDSLNELLIADLDDNIEDQQSAAQTSEENQSSTEQLSEEITTEVDELLDSTDDEIAFDAVEPQFDAQNEDEIDLLAGEDGVRMKLDLARAYIEMGDSQGAQDIINEVIGIGDVEQQQEANELLQSIK